MKRYRAPKAKPGELKAQWGKLPHDNPDLCYVWGDGANKRDGHMLHNMLTSKRARPAWSRDEQEQNGGSSVVYDPSFIEELEARGYDITTLRFSVQKKTPNAELTGDGLRSSTASGAAPLLGTRGLIWND